MAIVRRPLAGLLTALLVAALGGACGSNGAPSKFDPNGGDDASVADGDMYGDSPSFADSPSFVGDGANNGDGANGAFDVEPSTLQTISVTAGQMTPTVPFTATLAGSPIAAAWTVDRGDLASINAGPAPTGTLQPTGGT